jgi:hypothetical protein
MLAHHDQQASGNQDHAAHGRDDSLYRVLPANQSDFFNTHGRYHSRFEHFSSLKGGTPLARSNVITN